MKKKLVCVVGTRPEAIKMAPVIRALKASTWAQITVLATAQHRQMLDQVLDCFSIVPDIDFNLMKANQSLSSLTAQLIARSSELFEELKPDAVLVHGDTTTAMACAMAAFYTNTPVAHVEAGLRTGNIRSPFPEEFNRICISHIARWHYCPTIEASQNLQKQGIEINQILVTGNTVIDALLMAAARSEGVTELQRDGVKEILVTCHRRENLGAPLQRVCEALKRIAIGFPQHRLTYPVHPNPQVKELVKSKLGGIANISLVEPMEYMDFVSAMKRCNFVITDSGGIQEEAPALGKPVLVLRTETERPEVIEHGMACLVGTEADVIFSTAQRLLTDEKFYQSMAVGHSPYGDGQASQRITEHLHSSLM